MTRRAAFVTIGQSPRDDIMPTVREWLPRELEIREFGALDGLTRADVGALAPQPGEHRLVTRLRDGSEAVVGKPAIQRRLQSLFDDLEEQGFAFIVLLCTGHFPGLTSRTLLVEAQRVADHLTRALVVGARRLGVLVPHAEQMDELHQVVPAGIEVRTAFASPYAGPYAGDRFAEAGCELADCDLIVMHCMGYDEAMRAEVARASGRPVLLAQRMLAAAVAQLA